MTPRTRISGRMAPPDPYAALETESLAPNRTDTKSKERLIASVKAIAHPLRIEMYELLTLRGPLTVSTVAACIGVAVGSASYHLLQLAEAGFVEESVEAGSSDRRTRWWKATGQGLEWNPADLRGTPGGRELSTAAQALLVERRARKLMGWAQTWQDWDLNWVEAAEEYDTYLDLTASELSAMNSELLQVLNAWRQRKTGAEDQERRRVFVSYSAFPADTEPGTP